MKVNMFGSACEIFLNSWAHASFAFTKINCIINLVSYEINTVFLKAYFSHLIHVHQVILFAIIFSSHDDDWIDDITSMIERSILVTVLLTFYRKIERFHLFLMLNRDAMNIFHKSVLIFMMTFHEIIGKF